MKLNSILEPPIPLDTEEAVMGYDFSEEALLHPERRPVFVDPGPPFEPANRGDSLANAWWLSNLSHLAYYDAAGVAAGLSKKGLTLREFFDAEGTQAFLADGDGFSVLAFRGTQSPDFKVLIQALSGDRIEKLGNTIRGELKDSLVDVDIRLVSLLPTNDPAVQVQKGFQGALDRVWSKVEKSLEKNKASGIPVWYTGHSLGAALALLAAARRRPAALFTFGEPLLGNGTFSSLLSDCRHFRYVNCSDVVTTVPPALLGFHHCGSLRFFDENGDLHSEPDNAQILAARLKGDLEYQRTLPFRHPGQVKLRALADHTILNYTAGLLKALNKGSQPPGSSAR